MDSYNFSGLCGTAHLEIWNPHSHSLGLCFQKLFIITPVFALLAVVSAFFIGRQTEYIIRSKNELVVLYCRVAVVVAMIVFSVLLEPLLLLFEANVRIYWADVVSFGVQGLSWTVHLIYLTTLKVRRIGTTIRGSRLVLFAWVLSVLASVIFTQACYSASTRHWDPAYRNVMRALSITHLSLQMLYCICTFPHIDSSVGSDGVSGYRELHRDRLLHQQATASSSHSGQYTRFHEVAAPFHLGTAEANVPKLSYLTMHWVGALLEKGAVGLLRTVDDLHVLPQDLRTQQVSYTVRQQLMLSQPLPTDDRQSADNPLSSNMSALPSNMSAGPSSDFSESEETPSVIIKPAGSRSPADKKKFKFSLFWALHGVFGVQFYCIGVLKLVSDACGFAGPLLLHELVAYVDYKEQSAWKGYVYSLCLCLAALVSSLCSTHFNYHLARLNIKLRAALITSIYRKVQQINTAQRNLFSPGQIINLMSTDTDRMLNFGQSFHSCWSLPVQLGITLYLLYIQIGVAFLAGVAIVILLMPINRLLANKIGSLSQTMMSYKDLRVTLMTELLSMMKAVKLNAWEDVFAERINKERSGELKALAGRKYLDAACVYFWAATPVFIPIVTFTCYVLLGNEMDAARIFTAVALFNMLVMPLNAFPWVINGLVESYVSCKRIEKLLQVEEQDLSQYYTIVADMSTNNSELQLLISNATFSWEMKSGVETGEDVVENFSDSDEDSTVPHEYDDEDGYVGSGTARRGVVSSIKKSMNRASKRRKFFGDLDSDEEELVDDSEDLIDEDDDGLNIMAAHRGVNRAEDRRTHSSSYPEENKSSSSFKVLKNINLQVAKGEVIAIIGKTGSGKTTLLNAILAELVKTDGIVAVAALHHGFGYSAQDPWIQDLSIKDNILFGSDFDKARYERVVFACALEEDIRKFPKGDETKCGENGQCLSGGQKARLSLARAIYQQKGMYVLDGALSSVDGPVARHIMKEAVLGFLKDKTVLLTTHHIHLTTQCSTIVHLDRGRITHCGSPDEVLPNFLSTQDLLRDWWHDDNLGAGNAWATTGAVPRSNTLPRPKGNRKEGSRMASSKSSGNVKEAGQPQNGGEGLLLMEEHERYTLLNGAEDSSLESSNSVREYQEVGSLSWSVYFTYLSSIGYLLVFVTLMALIGMQFSRNLTDLWLAYWVSSSPGGDNNLTRSLSSSHDFKTQASAAQHYDGSVTVSPDYDLNVHPIAENAADVVAFGSWLIHPTIHRHTHAHPFSWVATMSNFIRVPHSSVQSRYPLYSSITQSSDLQDSSYEEFISPSTKYFLAIYCLIALGHSIFTILRAFGFAYSGVKAAKNIHDKLLKSILRSSITFFEDNPIGRVLNRFSTDLYTVDDALPFQLNIFLAQLFGLIGSIVLTVYGLPWMVLVYIPVGMLYYSIQHYYRYTSRDLRRIYALSLSPMYAHFTQALSGLSTIRAMRAVNSYSCECERLVECNQRAQLAIQAASQWLNLRLQLLGVLILGGVCGLALLQHHTLVINPGIVGLVITYALTINGFLNSVVTSFTETEREFISVERLAQYITGTPRDGLNSSLTPSIGVSEYDDLGDSTSSVNDERGMLNPGPNFPQHNTIRFEDVYVKYKFHNPYALKRINLRVGANEKIGILGRTGAGKSSLFSVLFRLIEPTKGRIFIDNVDISCLPLKRLRTTMAIVPQAAPLFTGSVRQNLDPFGKHSDTRIWSALCACYADTAIVSAVGRAKRSQQTNDKNNELPQHGPQTHSQHNVERPYSGRQRSERVNVTRHLDEEDAILDCLNYDMAEIGRNLSQGERQLLVLARAMLTQAQIVCVDEGTAQLDPITEELVQRALRECFRNTTLLIIAHRIRTLSFCDRLVVLEEGEIVEEGSPHQLMVRTDSRYSQLLRRQ